MSVTVSLTRKAAQALLDYLNQLGRGQRRLTPSDKRARIYARVALYEQLHAALAKHVHRYRYQKPAPSPCWGKCRCGKRAYRMATLHAGPRRPRMGFYDRLSPSMRSRRTKRDRHRGWKRR